MFLDTDYLFVFTLVGLYVYDSAQLCYFNEFFLSKGLRSSFYVQTVSLNYSFGKKFLFIPSLFFPSTLLFKVKWQTQNKTAPIVPADIEIIYNLAQQLELIQFLNTIGAILTLIALPLSIIGKASHTLIALIIIVIYAINLINILMIFLQRKTLSLRPKTLLLLFLDSLFCPPFALNLVKKISLNYAIQTEGLKLAQKLLQPPQLEVLITQIIKDIALLKTNHNLSNEQLTRLHEKEYELNQLLTSSEQE